MSMHDAPQSVRDLANRLMAALERADFSPSPRCDRTREWLVDFFAHEVKEERISVLPQRANGKDRP